MSGVMGGATFDTTIPSGVIFNKINMIKAFREYTSAEAWNKEKEEEKLDILHGQKYDAEMKLQQATERLQGVQMALDQQVELIENHRDRPFAHIDRVDQVCEEFGISKRASLFLTNSGFGLKDMKDAVELMIAIGDITGRPLTTEERVQEARYRMQIPEITPERDYPEREEAL